MFDVQAVRKKKKVHISATAHGHHIYMIGFSLLQDYLQDQFVTLASKAVRGKPGNSQIFRSTIESWHTNQRVH